MGASGQSVGQLEGLEKRYPSQLSGGQRQRVALARSLAPRPKVLLLDEPFGALDAKVREELRVWIRRLHEESQLTTLFVTHDQNEALEIANKILVINKGKIEQEGTPMEIFDKPATNFVAQFVGDTNYIESVISEPELVVWGPFRFEKGRNFHPDSFFAMDLYRKGIEVHVDTGILCQHRNTTHSVAEILN
jgi:ABC-type sulfate/molybdate transport systems ATPase subunit